MIFLLNKRYFQVCFSSFLSLVYLFVGFWMASEKCTDIHIRIATEENKRQLIPTHSNIKGEEIGFVFSNDFFFHYLDMTDDDHLHSVNGS